MLTAQCGAHPRAKPPICGGWRRGKLRARRTCVPARADGKPASAQRYTPAVWPDHRAWAHRRMSVSRPGSPAAHPVSVSGRTVWRYRWLPVPLSALTLA